MATTGQIITELVTGVRDTAGAVVASGNARFYVPGTLSAAAVYSDSACTLAISQPVVLNAGGQKLYAWSKVALRMIVKDATDTTTVVDQDPCNVVRAEQLYITNTAVNGGSET